MKVVAIVGSRREVSTTRFSLDRALAAAGEAGAEVAWAELRHFDLPFCDGRDDPSTYGGDTARLRALIAGADALLVGSPEYHGSMPGVLKNAIDIVGEAPFKGKMVGLVAVARGEAGAMNTLSQLRHVFRWVGAWVLPTQVSIPRSVDAFEASGLPIRPGLDDELLNLGREVVRYARLLAGNGHMGQGS